MAQSPNQLQPTVAKGMADMRFGGNSLSCQIDTTSAGALVAAQCVKIVDSAGGIPKVVEIAADTDDVFGVLDLSPKDATFEVGDIAEVSIGRGNVRYMEASAAIARNAQVMPVVSGSKVATATSGKRIIGRALDKASAAGDLIRVLIDLPGSTV